MPTPRTVTRRLHAIATNEWVLTAAVCAIAAPLAYWTPEAGIAAIAIYLSARYVIHIPRRPKRRAAHRGRGALTAEAAIARAAAVRIVTQRLTQRRAVRRS